MLITLVPAFDPLSVAGENVAVTPVGKPVVPSVTVPLKPFCGVMPTVAVIVWPFCIPSAAVGTASPKEGASRVNVKLDFAVCEPAVPVTVNVYTPGVAADVAAMFKVVLPEPGDAMVAGEKVAVTPVGIPDTVNATAELMPLVVVLTVAVLV
jgi:hypothetical protein